VNIVQPYARLMPPPGFLPDTPFTREHGEQMLRRSEWCARISHRSEEKQDAVSFDRFLRSIVLQHGDWSVTEHCVISADMVVDRGLSHELVRHRIAAYTQESTRFCNYGKQAEKGIGVVLPPELAAVGVWTQGKLLVLTPEEVEAYNTTVDDTERAHNEKTRQHWNSWLNGVATAEHEYLYQVNQLKVAPEIARDMLPHCLAVRMVATHNLRGWRHLMLMRTTAETHRKLRPLMGSLLSELKEKVPVLYEDVEFGGRQVDNLRKGR
jgi:thymidylate synthase (FAD)